MKKLIALLLSVLLLSSLFAGCQLKNVKKKDESGSIRIVTTVFPIYDWVREVSGDADASIEYLLDNGVDLHSFQPTASDIVDISDCDLFIYVGGESDKWVSDALDQAENDDLVVLDLMDVLGDKAKEEELVEGMQGEEEEEEEEEGEAEYDEHIWLSVKNAAVITQAICDAMADIDGDNADTYEANASAYIDKLNTLDAQYRKTVDDASVKTLLFGDRFPFRYLTDDYDLTYYAAFIGCSAESEASFETINFLSNKVDELKLKSIMKIETSDGSIAETVRDNTKDKDQQILTLDSMQNVTPDRIDDGETYLSIMESNLAVLKQALA